MASPFGEEKDHFFMQKALAQAQKAFDKDEVPIGAIVVDALGNIIARGHNLVEQRDTQLAHAEAIALERAGKKIGDWRLEGCWIYVTLEPCSMCMSLIELSRLHGVVFGAHSPLFGYRLDKELSLRVYKKSAVRVIEGVCAEETIHLLKQFFKDKRKKKSE